MPRCSGGKNPKGERKPGRMHLNGGEQDCAKHDSDNFSLLSTESRVIARNQGNRVLPAPLLLQGNDYEDRDGDWDDAQTEDRAAPDSSVILESDIFLRSPSSIFSGASSVFERRSPSTGSIADSLPPPAVNNDILPDGPVYPLPIPHDMDRIARIRVNDRVAAPALPQQQAAYNQKGDGAHLAVLIFILTIGMYGWYLWIFRREFQYQEDVIREHFGLVKRGGGSVLN